MVRDTRITFNDSHMHLQPQLKDPAGAVSQTKQRTATNARRCEDAVSRGPIIFHKDSCLLSSTADRNCNVRRMALLRESKTQQRKAVDRRGHTVRCVVR